MASERASDTRRRERGDICALCRASLERPGGLPEPGERLCRDCLRQQAYRAGRPYEVVLQFMLRDGLTVTFLAPDCHTSIGRRFEVGTEATLRALIQRTDPHPQILAEFDHCLRAWGRGTVHLYLTAQQFLRITRR